MGSFLLVSARQGDQVLANEYQDFLSTTGLREEELTHRVIDSVDANIGELEGFDGIFSGGSSLNVTNENYDEWQKHVHAELKKLIGCPTPTLFVCFGNTLVAELDGGVVGNTHPEEAGTTVVELTAAGLEDPLTRGLPPRFEALTGHKENVVEVNPRGVVLATGPTCPVQMVRATESTWAVQFHTDLTAEGLATRMGFYRGHGYFSDEDYEDIVSRARAIDTTAANQIMRNFVNYCLR